MRLAILVLAAILAVPAAAAAADRKDAPFDHASTGFDLRGAHRSAPCASCHQSGVFVGTPTRCEGCHNGRTATGKTAQHPPTSSRCDSCHRPERWSPVLRMDHIETMGTCAGCHNGVMSIGKPAGHIATAADCGSCHDTRDWARSVFDHTGITGACMTCHNGSTATGKPLNHVQTTSDCGSCHSTMAWHPAAFDHAGVTAPCSSCHNGSTATGKGSGHFVTTEECSSCHNTNAWTPISFSHTSPNYPGTHAGALTCKQCHTSNSQTIPWPYAAYQPACAGCHANSYKADSHKKTEVPTTVFYTVSELRDCAGSCHQYTDNTYTTILQSRSGHHHVSDPAWGN